MSKRSGSHGNKFHKIEKNVRPLKKKIVHTNTSIRRSPKIKWMVMSMVAASSIIATVLAACCVPFFLFAVVVIILMMVLIISW